jgi:polyisoprenoid-binding protein YceI
MIRVRLDISLLRSAAVAAALVLGAAGPGTVGLPPAGAASASAITVIPAGAFAIVPNQSTAVFAVPDNRGGFTGHTGQVSGRVDVESSGPETYSARITAAVDARSLTTDNAVRDQAMHATFLQTATYPSITFSGTATARPGLGIRPFPTPIRGRLTIRDVARDAEFNATAVALADRYVADATAVVRMAEYGIPYPRAFIFVARDPVTVTLHIVARAR